MRIEDFDYRALVVQSGWEGPAETYLIRMFRPLWNKEVKILQGFGKHGDSVTTRANKRSPWDTLHEGRNWAGGEGQTDKRTRDEILEQIQSYFKATTIFKNLEEVLTTFISGLKQQA